MRGAMSLAWRRASRIAAAVALVASAGLASDAGAAASDVTFTIDDLSLARGATTTFTSTFDMDEGVAQADLNLPGGLTETFDAACDAQGPRTCSVTPAGLVTVTDGGPPSVDNVEVKITGTIAAGTNFPLDSDEGAGPGALPLPPIAITLNQGGDAVSAPRMVTIEANPATDAEIQITTTAPAASGATAGRGSTEEYKATLKRVGFLAQATTATATLVADAALGTTVPTPTQTVSWAVDEAADKEVTLTVNVPSNIATGIEPSYHIEVTYDPNLADGAAPLDKEIGALRSFEIVAGTGDAVVSIATDAPTDGVDVPRGTSVTYTATLTRTGKLDQATVVNLSLLPIGDQRGTAPGAAVNVPFVDDQETATRSITVTVPAGATVGNVQYRFQGVYDPTGTGGPITDTITGESRSFDVVPAQPSFTLTPGNGTVSRGDPLSLEATLNNPPGADPVTAGIITVTVPSGMVVGTPTATAGFLVPPVLNPFSPGAVPQVVTVNYPTIAPGETRTLTVPVTVLESATKKPAADLAVTASFVSATPPINVTRSSDFEITPEADIRMVVDAPAEEQLDPDAADVVVSYRIENLGPDPAAAVTFTATAPVGFVGSVNPVETDGDDPGDTPDWSCTDIAAGGTTSTCTYLVNPLGAGDTTAPVRITWTFDRSSAGIPGPKAFPARASTSTVDPTPGNDDATDTTSVADPISGVTISASATPDPVDVAVDKDAIVTVQYQVRNFGPKNIRAEITLTAPLGADRQSLTGVGACDAALTTCSLGTLNKNGSTLTVTALYRVPQGSFTANQAAFSATIKPVNGSFATPECPTPPGPPTPPGCSVTTASDTVTGRAPGIDIGLAPVPGDPIVNRPDVPGAGTNPSATQPVNEPRTFTFQNRSTELTVRAGTAFIDLTPSPATGIGTPAGCTVTVAPTVRCLVSATDPVPVATAAGPGTLQVTMTIPLHTADAVTITATAVIEDPGNRRVVEASPATPDSRELTLDLNRTPSVTADIGPGVPGGGTLTHLPLSLHDDDDGDALTVVSAPVTCPSAACVVTGGTVTGLTVAAGNARVTVTFTDAVPTDPAVGVSVVVTYGVTDAKSATDSTLKVKLLPRIVFDGSSATRASVQGSFGKAPTTTPRSFGEVIAPERVGPTPTPLEVLGGPLGSDANGSDAFPGLTSYDLESVSNDSLNVKGSTVDTTDGTTPGKQAVRYQPAPGYTNDRGGVPVVEAPADSFTYKATGRNGTVDIYTVEAPVVVEIKNQNPIGVDDTFIVQNEVTQQVSPGENDLDGNTVDEPITVKRDPVTGPLLPSAKAFTFDDEGDLVPARRVTIRCIGPVPELDPATNLPVATPVAACPESGEPTLGFVRPGQDLMLRTPTATGAVTARLTGASTPATADDFRVVTVTPDATVVGDLQFVYVLADNYGGSGFGLATVNVPNTPPQVIEGVRTVLKNTATVVVDTRLAVQDANGDTIVITSTPDRTKHGKVTIGDNRRTITYTPDTDFLGADELVYNVSDNRGDAAAAATLQLNVIEQSTVLAAAAGDGGGGAGGGGGGAPAGRLAATGGDPLALTVAAGSALALGLALVQAGRRRRSRPLLDGARHLRA